METKIDLSLVSLRDICDELDKRFDAYIFSYVKNRDARSEEKSSRYFGGKFHSIGLCEALKHRILKDINKEDNICLNG